MLKIVPINFLMVRIGQMLKTEPIGVSQACLVTWMKVGALTIEGLRQKCESYDNVVIFRTGLADYRE